MSDQTPDPAQALAAAARKSAIGAVEPGEAPSGSALLTAMGGVRGLVESILPGLAFLIIYAITGEVVPSVVVPVIIAVVFVVVRVVTRTPYMSAVAGAFGVGISAGLSLITGRAEDNFILGFFLNGAFLVAMLISLVARHPLIGVVASLITSDGGGYRTDRAKFRVALIATLLWCGLFSLRLAVEVPLYFAENASALAAAKLILGVPLYAAVLWVTWLLMRTAYSKPAEAPTPSEA